MRTWPIKLAALFITLLFGISVFGAETFAWETEQQALNDLLEEDANTRVTLLKREKTMDGTVTENAIPNAVFYLFKKDGTRLGGEFKTDQNGQIDVTLSPGNYYYEEISPAEGFTYDCDSSGKLIRRYPFTVAESDETVTVKAYNRPSINENIEIVGEKIWELNGCHVSLPASITVRLISGGNVIEKQTVSPDAAGKWTYRFTAPKYRADGVEIAYTVDEEPVSGFYATYSGYNITNTYIAPIEVELPVITKIGEGEDAPREKFSFILEGTTGTPMPDGSIGNTKKVSRTGKGTAVLGSLTFTEPGDYTYTVYEVAGDDFNWKYDPAEYTVTFHVIRSGAALVCDYTIKKDGRSASGLVFTNTYEEINLNEKVTISGQKTWYHRDNPVENQPDEIIVKLYADGKLVQQRRVTEKEDWKYSFKVPKYNEDGDEILYEIDESDIENYSKKVQGYDLINTYTGTTLDPDEPGEDTSEPVTPDKPDNPPKTGEEFELNAWIALMAFSFCGAVLMLLLLIAKPKDKGKRLPKKGRRL